MVEADGRSSIGAMVRRLEELKLTKPGTRDWFDANGGITDLQARQVLGDSGAGARAPTAGRCDLSGIAKRSHARST